MRDDTPNDENQMDSNEQPDLLTHPSYEELLQKLEDAEQKAQQNLDRALRMQAENENSLRRMERDVSNAHKYALEKFLTELLPIVDSLELCVSSAASETKDSFIEGVNLTLKMFYSALEKFGVKQVNPVGEVFDPEHQQAISMQFDPSAKPGMVLSVLQKGYTLNDRLLRPALVVVSKTE
jgi:molecular chaperone GrpE